MLSFELWVEPGFTILEACTTPDMTLHLGGPELPEQLGV